MDIKLINEVIESVKYDNVKEFSVLLKQEDFLHCSFGRFPLLTILYLFNANKILNKYEKNLINFIDYKIISTEPYALYQKFKSVSGRVLRLYLNNELVSPMEILLIMGKYSHLKYVYNKLNNKDENLLKRLKRIEKIKNNQEIIFTTNTFIIQKKPLKKELKRLIFASAIIAIVFSIFAVIISSYSYGLGNKDNPLIINNATQLKMALTSDNKFFELGNDINVNFQSSYVSSCNINGNGNTIYVNNYNGQIFSEFSGKLSNINIVFKQQDKIISSNYAYLIGNNKGELEGVNISISGNITVKNATEATYVSGIAITNSNLIKDCSVISNIKINGVSTTDTFFSCIAGVNVNNIENCFVQNNSVIISSTADVCGIAVENAADASILNCYNNANMLQSTNAVTWSPNVAGINIFNYGTIENCTNNGTLSVVIESKGTAGEVVPESFCAGISAVNYNIINKCKNTGSLKVDSTFYNAYIGGIVAFNSSYYQLCKISNCASTGEMCLKDNGESKSYIGGIVGCSSGMVEKCYSIVTFDKTDNVKIGGIIGLSHYGIGYDTLFGFVYASTYDTWYSTNYFYIKDLPVSDATGIAGIYPSDAVFSDYGMNICKNVQEIENCEVFW